jgi:broad specificity phosphatase PhoE
MRKIFSQREAGNFFSIILWVIQGDENRFRRPVFFEASFPASLHTIQPDVMKILEVRRHAKRFRPSEHLAQVGVTHARRVGETMGTFSLVISSTLPRAYETAIAMGFAVDRQEEWLSDYPDMIEEELPYPVTFAQYAQAARSDEQVEAYCRDQAQHWLSVVREISDGTAALLTSHGGVIEMGAIGCLLTGGNNDKNWRDVENYGDALSYCEGIRLEFDESRIVPVIDSSILRVIP